MNTLHHMVHVPRRLRRKVVKVEQELAEEGVDVEFDVHVKRADCKFEYGDFRDDELSAQKWEGFLVVGSGKGDTLSLFESKR
jgi:hypothetical protein